MRLHSAAGLHLCGGMLPTGIGRLMLTTGLVKESPDQTVDPSGGKNDVAGRENNWSDKENELPGRENEWLGKENDWSAKKNNWSGKESSRSV